MSLEFWLGGVRPERHRGSGGGAARFPLNKRSDHSDTANVTKDFDRATNPRLLPDKPWGATSKPLIVLNLQLTLNQRVPGSSPGAPTKLFNSLGILRAGHSDKR